MVTKEFFIRRQDILSSIPYERVAVLVPAAVHKVRSNDTEYPFRQESNFFYLTGFNEPSALLVLIKTPDRVKHILFCQPKDAHAEIWHGRRLGVIQAKNVLEMDEVYAYDDVAGTLEQLLSEVSCVCFSQGGPCGELDRMVTEAMCHLKGKARRGIQAPTVICDLDPYIQAQRVLKSEEEIHAIRKACSITMDAFKRTMRAGLPGCYEYELAADIMHEFLRQGGSGPAYNSIVAGGDNSCILHYQENSAKLQDGVLLLIDAGCEFAGYAADVTRTFPVNGRFSASQKMLYDLVLKAQESVIDIIKPGVAWNELEQTVLEVLTEGLLELGILSGDFETLLENRDVKRFYMHSFGHFLGLDVHDVGAVRAEHGAWISLEKNMVFTVEPGLYFPYGTEGVDEKWHGVGIRIEDDVLVTATGCEVLTKDLPKTTADIEALMQTS